MAPYCQNLLLVRAQFRTDPHWQDLPLLYEYFHGDNGAGLGASHETGWSGLVAVSASPLHVVDPEQWPTRSLEV